MRHYKTMNGNLLQQVFGFLLHVSQRLRLATHAAHSGASRVANVINSATRVRSNCLDYISRPPHVGSPWPSHSNEVWDGRFYRPLKRLAVDRFFGGDAGYAWSLNHMIWPHEGRKKCLKKVSYFCFLHGVLFIYLFLLIFYTYCWNGSSTWYSAKTNCAESSESS